MTDLVRIATTAGTTYYNLDAPVLTKAGVAVDGRQIYIVQKAGDLQPGQQVAWDKQYVNVTLEQIADGLTTEPTYAEAQAAVFIANSGKRLIPRFREFLIRGLQQQAKKGQKGIEFMAGMKDADLDARIKFEGDLDFTAAQYKAMEDEVHTYIAAYNEVEGLPLVTGSAVRKWLQGETVGPRNKAILTGLVELNPDFREYFEAGQGERTLWRQYRIWVDVRRGLRSEFAKVKAGGGNGGRPAAKEEPALEDDEYTSMAPFLRHLLNRFYQPISNQHVNVMVTGIEKVDIAGKGNDVLEAIFVREEGVVPHLYKGLCRELPQGLGFVLPKGSVSLARMLLADSIDSGIRAYFRKNPNAKAEVKAIMKGFYFKDVGALKASEEDAMFIALASYISQLDLNRDLIEEQTASIGAHAERAKAVKNACEFVLAHAYDGRMDSALGLPQGTFASAIETARIVNDLVPKDYTRMRVNEMKLLNRQADLEVWQNERARLAQKRFFTRALDRLAGIYSKLDKEEKALADEITALEAETAGLKGRLDFDDSHKKTLLHDVAGFAVATGKTIEELLQGSEAVELSAYAAFKEGKEGDYVTYDEAKRLFDDMGLPRRFLNLIPTKVFIDKVKVSGRVRETYKSAMKSAPPE